MGYVRSAIKQQREKKKREGLIFNVAIYPYVDKHDGGILLHVWFSGDTLTYKRQH